MKKIFFAITLATLTNQALTTSTFASDLEFTIAIKDHKFIPSTLEVPAHKKFKLIIDNQDETAEEFESHDLSKEKIIMGGKKGTIIITPLEAGEYNFFGDFHAKTTTGKLIAK